MVVTSWMREEKLERLLTNPPTIMEGAVVAHSSGITTRSSTEDTRGREGPARRVL